MQTSHCAFLWTLLVDLVSELYCPVLFLYKLLLSIQSINVFFWVLIDWILYLKHLINSISSAVKCHVKYEHNTPQGLHCTQFISDSYNIIIRRCNPKHVGIKLSWIGDFYFIFILVYTFIILILIIIKIWVFCPGPQVDNHC